MEPSKPTHSLFTASLTPSSGHPAATTFGTASDHNHTEDLNRSQQVEHEASAEAANEAHPVLNAPSSSCEDPYIMETPETFPTDSGEPPHHQEALQFDAPVEADISKTTAGEALTRGQETSVHFILAAFKPLVQGAMDATELKESLVPRLEKAETEARHSAHHLEIAHQQLEDLTRSLAANRSEIESLTRTAISRDEELSSLRAESHELESRNSQLVRELQSAINESTPEVIAPLFAEIMGRLSPVGQRECRFQLHTLRYLSSQDELNPNRFSDSIASLSRTLYSELESQPEFVASIRSALNGWIPDGFSIAENEPGDPIDERYMTGAGLQGCRTVSSIRSWAVLKDGLVLRKADIVPAP